VRAALVVNFGQQPGADLLGPGSGLRSRRHDLFEVVPLLGDRVDARVHDHSQGTAGQDLDPRAGAPSGRVAVVKHRLSRESRTTKLLIKRLAAL
jgi:hypothetical protein